MPALMAFGANSKFLIAKSSHPHILTSSHPHIPKSSDNQINLWLA
jgi:hypothetical protein